MATPPIASLHGLEDCKIGYNLCSISPMFGSTGWKVTTKGIRTLPADCLYNYISKYIYIYIYIYTTKKWDKQNNT